MQCEIQCGAVFYGRGFKRVAFVRVFQVFRQQSVDVVCLIVVQDVFFVQKSLRPDVIIDAVEIGDAVGSSQHFVGGHQHADVILVCQKYAVLDE